MRFRVLSPANREIVDAADHLQTQCGEGVEFLRLVFKNLDAIEADPYSFPLWELNTTDLEIRRVLLTKFQYLIFYQIIRDEVIVWTVRHGSRDSAGWLKRAQQVGF